MSKHYTAGFVKAWSSGISFCMARWLLRMQQGLRLCYELEYLLLTSHRCCWCSKAYSPMRFLKRGNAWEVLFRVEGWKSPKHTQNIFSFPLSVPTILLPSALTEWSRTRNKNNFIYEKRDKIVEGRIIEQPVRRNHKLWEISQRYFCGLRLWFVCLLLLPLFVKLSFSPQSFLFKPRSLHKKPEPIRTTIKHNQTKHQIIIKQRQHTNQS